MLHLTDGSYLYGSQSYKYSIFETREKQPGCVCSGCFCQILNLFTGFLCILALTPNREPYRIPELTESGRPSFPGRMALGGGGRVGAGAWGEPR